MTDTDEGLTLHWTYWPESEHGFTVENVTPETEFAAEWLDHVATKIEPSPRVDLRADDNSCSVAAEWSDNHPHPTYLGVVCWHGWLLDIRADNAHVIYRIGDYLPEVNRWSARWPD